MIKYDRQLGIFDPTKYGSTPVTVIGAGSVGSLTTMLMAKVGFNNITVYDTDTVEEHNLPNQFYPTAALGHAKVHALATAIMMFTNTEIRTKQEMYEDQELEGIILSTVDSMSARAKIFAGFQDSDKAKVLIDSRMGGLEYRILTITHATLDKWSWYPDNEAVQERCTEKTIIYNVAGIASHIVCNACKVAMDQPVPCEIVGEYKSTSMMVM